MTVYCFKSTFNADWSVVIWYQRLIDRCILQLTVTMKPEYQTRLLTYQVLNRYNLLILLEIFELRWRCQQECLDSTDPRRSVAKLLHTHTHTHTHTHGRTDGTARYYIPPRLASPTGGGIIKLYIVLDSRYGHAWRYWQAGTQRTLHNWNISDFDWHFPNSNIFSYNSILCKLATNSDSWHYNPQPSVTGS